MTIITLTVLAVALTVGLYARRRISAVLAAAMFAVVGVALVAAPVSASAVPVGPDAHADSVLSLDPFMVTVIAGTLIPILGGVVLKQSTSGTVKSLVNLVLSAVASIVNVSTTEGGLVVISEDVIKSTALTFIISIATLYGVWQPTGIDAKLKATVGNTDGGS